MASCFLLFLPLFCSGLEARANPQAFNQATSLKLPSHIPFRAGTLWGYADSTGAIKIKPKYKQAEPFEGSVARIADSLSWGLIDEKGKEIIKPRYKTINEFENGLALVSTFNYNSGIIDQKGQEIVPAVYQKVTVEMLKDLHVPVIKATQPKDLTWEEQKNRIKRTNTKTGLFSREGKPILPVIYDEIVYLGGGLFSVFQGADASVFKIDGTEIPSLKHHVPSAFHDPRAPKEPIMLVHQRKLGFIDRTGKVVIPMVYESGQDFSEGLAGVYLDQKWGYINKANKLEIPATFEGVTPFQKGLAIVKKESLWGIIDRTGKVVTDFIYREISYSTVEDCYILYLENEKFQAFYNPATGKVNPTKGFYMSNTLKDGLRLAVKPVDEFHRIYKKGYVNEEGKIMIPLDYFDATYFHFGMAAVRQDNLWGVIDTKGKTIIPFMFERIEILAPDLIKVGQLPGRTGPMVYGLINKSGEEITPIVYTHIGPFTNGLAVAGKQNNTAIINTKGQEVIPMAQIPKEYFACQGWKNGLMKVCNYRKSQSGYIDRYGKQYFKD
ncbi:WG repeat-containing protein [Adhaeribacter soli]|uniref:WG repeat-containing protein n=1 Tax=Adhaeribacter soli TaxID=2607655 RepID=A0A5N1IXI4_9BACT|nr:WG repeat-containing protein [Adhaeribacter soli]KAA9338994.1 WG repeat-containing protein [Adhaeribacter soli]